MQNRTSMRRVWAEGEWPTAAPARQAEVDETPLKPSDAGFLLLDSSLQPIYANQDAMRILCYPTAPKSSKAVMQAIKKRIKPLLRGHLPSLGNPSLVEFPSGKRRYLLRAFYLDSHRERPHQPAYALLIERGHHVLLKLAHVCNQ